MKTLTLTTRTFVAIVLLTLAVGSGAPMADAQGGPAPTLCESMLSNYQTVCAAASLAASAALGPDSTNAERRHAAVLNYGLLKRGR